MISKILNFALLVLVVILIGNYFYRLPRYSKGNILPENQKNLLLQTDTSDAEAYLIHFWASWCTPCRKENKKLVDTYKGFVNQSDSSRLATFEIISIALERKEGGAVHAIVRDSLFWPRHIVETNGFQSPLALSFGVRKIPTTYLVDKDMKVIYTNPSPKQLSRFLEAL